jgi:hypothetical protein
MLRIGLILCFAGSILADSSALAQCRGGGGGQGTTGTTGTTTASGIGTTGTVTGASRLLTGPGSLAYDVMMAQMISQQMAQRQTMLAMQQQKMKQEKLAARRYRAEQARTQVAESRARTRAALAAQNGLSPAKPKATALASYQPVRR